MMSSNRRSITHCWRSHLRYAATALGLSLLLAFQAVAAPRNFQMALFYNTNLATDSDYVDLNFFGAGENQPAGRSIMQIDGVYASANWAANLAYKNYDWSRIVAVIIDEPYWATVGTNYSWDSPCWDPWNDPRYPAIAAKSVELENAEAALRVVSSSTRFWVNFSLPEITWLMDGSCPFQINGAYLDVISFDWYRPFNEIQYYYDWLWANRASPHQQMALLPGTFWVSQTYSQQAFPTYDAWTAASWLQGYFNYADTKNQNCWDALGPRGMTRVEDGCAIFAVIGFPGRLYGDETFNAGWTGVGIFNPYSYPIANAWIGEHQNPKFDHMIGNLEYFDQFGLTLGGWAINRTTAELSPWIDIWIDNQYVSSTLATEYRPDVGAYYGLSNAGFNISIPFDWWYGCHQIGVYAVSAIPGNGYNQLYSTYYCNGYGPYW